MMHRCLCILSSKSNASLFLQEGLTKQEMSGRSFLHHSKIFIRMAVALFVKSNQCPNLQMLKSYYNAMYLLWCLNKLFIYSKKKIAHQNIKV